MQKMHIKTVSVLVFSLLLFFQLNNAESGTVNVHSGGVITIANNRSIYADIQMLAGSSFVSEASGATCPNIGNLNMASTSSLEIEIGGTTECSEYDQVRVTGSVELSGAVLSLTQLGAFVPSDSDTFIIISNDDSDSITGTFAGFPEGGIVSIGGKSFNISYQGGDGNDIELYINSADSQTITFLPFTDPTYEVGSTVTLAATASSGLLVSYTSLTTGVCTVNETILSMISPGTCTIVASQAGNGLFDPAQDVQQSFEVIPEFPWFLVIRAILSGIKQP
ncbi:MAG: hypothetical protein GY779_06495 [Gammaproteobacteria bacterium]|nr:hypothetical protein [Gammaproteobacteria bacterium]